MLSCHSFTFHIAIYFTQTSVFCYNLRKPSRFTLPPLRHPLSAAWRLPLLSYYVCATFSLPGPPQHSAGRQLQPSACLLQQIGHLTPVTACAARQTDLSCSPACRLCVFAHLPTCVWSDSSPVSRLVS